MEAELLDAIGRILEMKFNVAGQKIHSVSICVPDISGNDIRIIDRGDALALNGAPTGHQVNMPGEDIFTIVLQPGFPHILEQVRIGSHDLEDKDLP